MASNDYKEHFPIDCPTPKINQRIESLLDSSKYHDCEFKLSKPDNGGEEIVYAHSLILATCSPVFEALFYGPLAEKKPINVPDIDPVAFKIMIKFIYTDNVEFNCVESACNVLYAAKKYIIYTLANQSIAYILLQMNEVNCLQIHSFATFVSEERLVEESWLFFCSHVEDVARDFTSECLSKEFMLNMLNEKALNGGEVVLFDMCSSWAKWECKKRDLPINGDNIRSLLIDVGALSKIRLLTLTLEEFENGPKTSGVLNSEEIKYIIKNIEKIQKVKQDLIDYLKSMESTTSPKDAKVLKPTDLTENKEIESIKQEILKDNKCLMICKDLECRKKIALKKVYCHRYIERDTKGINPHNTLKIMTVVSSNKSVRLVGIFLNAKVLPIPQLNTIYTHTCVIERDYLERLDVRITNDLNELLFSTYFTETVKYGTVFKIPLQSPVVLERNKDYEIKIDFVNCLENYQFGTGNPVSKFMSGLTVCFKEWACTGFGPNEKFVESDDLSAITGLELLV